MLEGMPSTDATLEPLDDWLVVEPLDETETATGLIVPVNEATQTRTGIVAASHSAVFPMPASPASTNAAGPPAIASRNGGNAASSDVLPTTVLGPRVFTATFSPSPADT